MRLKAKFCVPVAAFLTLSIATAQGPIDVDGTWDLQMFVFFESMDGLGTRGAAAEDCTFEGSATIDQDGTDITGNALVQLTDGSLPCPPFLGGNLTGAVDGDQINMGIMTGIQSLGQADFLGAAAMPKTLKKEIATRGPAPMPDVINGEFEVTTGPFAGANGGWIATRSVAEEEVSQIPTLNSLGLLLLATTLLGGGIFAIQRFRHS